MIPCLESAGGNCQDAVILVEFFTVSVKLVGAPEGTVIKSFVLSIYYTNTLALTLIWNYTENKPGYSFIHSIILHYLITII